MANIIRPTIHLSLANSVEQELNIELSKLNLTAKVNLIADTSQIQSQVSNIQNQIQQQFVAASGSTAKGITIPVNFGTNLLGNGLAGNAEAQANILLSSIRSANDNMVQSYKIVADSENNLQKILVTRLNTQGQLVQSTIQQNAEDKTWSETISSVTQNVAKQAEQTQQQIYKIEELRASWDKLKASADKSSGVVGGLNQENISSLNTALDSGDVASATHYYHLLNTELQTLNANAPKVDSFNAIEKANERAEQLSNTVSTLTSKVQGLSINGNFSNQFTQLAGKVNQLNVDYEKFQQMPNGNEKLLALQKLTSTATQLNSEFNKINTANTAFERLNVTSKRFDEYLSNNTVTARKFGTDIENIRAKIQGLFNESDPVKFSEGVKEVNAQIRTLKAEADATGKVGKSLFETLGDEVRKFTSWFSAAQLVMQSVQAIKQAISTVKELDTTMTNFQIAAGVSTEQAEKMMDSYIQMGQQMGATGVETGNAADEWLRQGYAMKDTNTLIKDSVTLAKVGEIETSEATTYLTSAMKGYGLSVSDAIGVVDKFTAVDKVAAVSAGGLAEAMSRTASSAKLAGIDFNTLTGILAVIGETTQKDMSEVGTSVQAILSRMENVKAGKFVKDSEDDVNDVEKVLGKVGIALRDTTGQFRNMQDVLNEVGKNWDSYDSVQKNAIATALAGTRQRENAIVAFTNWNKVLEYSNTAAESAGSSTEKLADYQNSLEGKTKSMTASWEAFSKSLINSDAYKGVLDFLTNMGNALTGIIQSGQVLPTVVGAFGSKSIIQSVIGSHSTSLSDNTLSGINEDVKAINSYVTAVKNGSTQTEAFSKYLITASDSARTNASAVLNGGKSIQQFAQEERTAAIATQQATAATQVLHAVLRTIAWVAIAEGIQLVVQWIYNLIHAEEIQKQKMDDAVSAYEQAKQDVQTVNDKLKETNDKIKELQDKGPLAFVEKEQLENLKQTTKELQLQADIKQKEADQKAVDLGNTAVETYNKRFGGYDVSKSAVNEYASRESFATDSESSNNISALIAAYEKFTELRKKAFDEKDNDQIEVYDDLLTTVKNSLNDDVSSMQEVQTALEKIPVEQRSMEVNNALTTIGKNIDFVYSYLDPEKLKTINFDSVFNSEKFSAINKELSELASQGKLTADTLSGSKYSEFVKALNDVGISAKDAVTQISALNNVVSTGSVDKFKEAVDEAGTSITNITKSISDYASSLKSLDTAIDTVNKGDYLSGQQVAELIQQYPQLTNSVITTAKGYTFKANALQDVRNALAKEKEASIQAAISDAENTLNSVMNQIKAYSDLVGAIQSVADAKRALANMSNASGVGNIKSGTMLKDSMSPTEYKKYIAEQSEMKNVLNEYIGVSSELESDKAKLQALQTSSSFVGQNHYYNADNSSSGSGTGSGNSSGTTAAETAAKKAATALKEQYDSELKVIEANEEENKYGENKINYYNALLALYNKWKDSALEADSKVQLQKKVYDALKAYQKDVLDKSYDELQNRIDFGYIKENSQAELDNLLAIQKNLTTNPNMSTVNTEENRLTLQKKIYDVKKGIIETDLSDLDTQVSLGVVQENSLQYINALYAIKQKINQSDLNTYDKQKELDSINEKLLSARKSYIKQLESNLSDETIKGSYGYRIKLIQDEIDAINNQADAASKELAVEKAKAAWEEARQNKSNLIYREGSGLNYEADSTTVNEKATALSDAEREEKLEKLKEEKQSIQDEEDAEKESLEKILKRLENSSNTSWSNIQKQINKVIGNISSLFKGYTSTVSDETDEQESDYDDLSDTVEDSYDKQTDSMDNYIAKSQELLPKIQSVTDAMRSAIQKLADAYYNLNGQIDRRIRLYALEESARETANDNYRVYNSDSKASGYSVHYASGTDYSIGGIASVNENGYEAKFEPTGNGEYRLLKEGTKVFTAKDTSMLKLLAQNPQNVVGNNSNNNKETRISMAGANFNLPNVVDANSFMQELSELETTVEQTVINGNK